jgi:hypothetical protein
MKYIANKSKKNRNKAKNKTLKRRASKKSPFPIDVVYTWKGEEMSNNRRLAYNYELKYSLRSIYFFAPWVNKIYILMNNFKQPSWIKNNDKIVIVEHKDTFPSSKYLPNTNSNAIETTIANIKGLSNHYIYFNDDIFLGKKVKYTDFFTPDGKAKIDDYVLNLRNVVKDGGEHKLNFGIPQNADKLYKHIPISQIKDSVLEFNKTYADYVDWIRMTKKRNDRGFDICEKNNLNSPCQQIHYPIAKFMYLQDKAKLVNNENNVNKLFYYVPSIDPTFAKKLNKIFTIRPKFFCINDVETDPKKRKIVSKEMLEFFNEYYPNKPDFEK